MLDDSSSDEFCGAAGCISGDVDSEEIASELVIRRTQ